jgi:ABC-type dipeptide/oligopeptide/nickel transport system permease subunit
MIWFRLPLASKIGAGILFLYMLITLAGFFFLPDSSPDANAQVPELGQLPPLSRANTLKITLPVNQQKSLTQLYKEIALAKGQKPFIRQDTIWARSCNNLAVWFLLPNVVLGIDKTSNQAEDLIRRTGKPYLLADEKVEWWEGQGWKKMPLDELGRRFWQAHYREKIYWLGTDFYGRDVLSRLVRGGAYSLLIGLVSVFFFYFSRFGLRRIIGFRRRGHRPVYPMVYDRIMGPPFFVASYWAIVCFRERIITPLFSNWFKHMGRFSPNHPKRTAFFTRTRVRNGG